MQAPTHLSYEGSSLYEVTMTMIINTIIIVKYTCLVHPSLQQPYLALIQQLYCSWLSIALVACLPMAF